MKYIAVSGDVDDIVLKNLSDFTTSFSPKSTAINYQATANNPVSKYIKKEKSYFITN